MTGQIDMDGHELTEQEAAAERRRIRLHGKPWNHGIHWPGPCSAGTEIERADYIEEDPFDDHSPIYEGDLEAAHVVAENGCPWLAFEDFGADAAPPRWVVTAFEKRLDRAEQAKANAAQCAGLNFYKQILFDGRAETLVLNEEATTYVRARPR